MSEPELDFAIKTLVAGSSFFISIGVTIKVFKERDITTVEACDMTTTLGTKLKALCPEPGKVQWHAKMEVIVVLLFSKVCMAILELRDLVDILDCQEDEASIELLKENL